MIARALMRHEVLMGKFFIVDDQISLAFIIAIVKEFLSKPV